MLRYFNLIINSRQAAERAKLNELLQVILGSVSIAANSYAFFHYLTASDSASQSFFSKFYSYFYLNINSHQDFSRYSAARAWAVSPSPRAITDAVRPRVSAPCSEAIIRLERFWKSYTPSGDEKRAVREVGST